MQNAKIPLRVLKMNLAGILIIQGQHLKCQPVTFRIKDFMDAKHVLAQVKLTALKLWMDTI